MPWTPGDETEDTGWLAVTSKCHSHVRWEPRPTHGNMHVKFKKSGLVYVYLVVPRSVFDDYMDLPSVGGSQGAFFVANVRDNYRVRGPY